MSRSARFAGRGCGLILLAAAGWAAATAPAAAQASAAAADYTACDGYGAPSREGDGMTRYATVLGLFSPPGKGTTDRLTPGTGGAAVRSCTLAIDGVPPTQWLRKISLLRARAAHRLENAEPPDAALADLDLADAAVRDPNDPFYKRSLGVGVDLLRAYALRREGKAAEAQARVRQALQSRPYSRGVATAALLALGPRADAATIDATTATLARLRPEVIDVMFTRALDDARYGDALALYPQLTPAKRPVDGYYTEAGLQELELSNKMDAELFWAWRTGAAAYALAARGKAAEARAMLEAGRKRLADAIDPPAIPADEAPRAAQRRFLVLNYNARILAQVTPVLDRWATLVDLRLMVSAGHAEEAARQLAAKPPPSNWAVLELLQTLAGEPIPEAPAIATAARQLRAMQAAHSDIPDGGITQLFNSLPEAEVAGRMPPYKEAKRPLLAMKTSPADEDAQGYRITPPNDKGVMTVRFRGDNSTEAIIEEMALLYAADAARKAGKRGFIIVGDRNTKHSVVTTYYGTPMRSDPNGFDAQYDIILVDPAALPGDYSQASWRVMDADEVYRSLAPIYITAAAP